jgi:sRNA-binding protein
MSSTPPSPPSPPGSSAADCAQQLRRLFPALFDGPPRPLKLRIQADIQQRAPGTFARKALSAFLHRHTGSTAYLNALVRGSSRLDLDGQPAGEISEEHRQAAREELARRRANHEARRALEDGLRRHRAALARDFETTTLTRANFCALKGIAVEALDELLEQARREAAEARPPARGERREQRPQAAVKGR